MGNRRLRKPEKARYNKASPDFATITGSSTMAANNRADCLPRFRSRRCRQHAILTAGPSRISEYCPQSVRDHRGAGRFQQAQAQVFCAVRAVTTPGAVNPQCRTTFLRSLGCPRRRHCQSPAMVMHRGIAVFSLFCHPSAGHGPQR